MKSWAGRLAFGIGLALAQRVWAGNAFEAVLVGANEVPGPGIAEGSFVAVVVVEGTKVTLTLTSKEARGWMSAHLHRGATGATGRLVAEFPWSSGDGSPRTSLASVSEKVAADLVAKPENFYVDVHTPSFPAGAARGQLAVRANAEASVTPAIPAADPATAVAYDPEVRAVGFPPLALPVPVPSPREQSINFPEPRPKVYRDPDFRLDASASSGLRVTFTGSGDCTVYGETVHILSAGKCWVTAHQPGDSRFDAAGDAEQRIVIEKARQRIDGAAPATKTYLDPDFPVPMSATSGLAVVFFAWGDCTVNDSYMHLTGAGSCSFTAHQPGDSNYLAARIVDQQFPIAKADQTIDFPEFSVLYYGPAELPLYARASSDLPVVFSAWGPCSIVGSSLWMSDSGECAVTADQPGDRNFNAAPSVKRTLQIFVPPSPP